MNYPEAFKLASVMVEDMRPFCERIEIAGSIRRQKQSDIKDVEIVAIPKWTAVASGLFAEDSTKENELFKWAQTQTAVEWIKPGTSIIAKWQVKPDGKYWRGMFFNGVKLDLFLTTPDQFGLIFLIRTGPADFSHKMVTLKSQGGWLKDELGIRIQGGNIKKGDEIIPTPEEKDVFKAMRYKFVEPENRR